MNILILGAGGMLGHDLVDVFSVEHNVTAWKRDDLDITDKDVVADKIKSQSPEVIINATAYTNVDACEEQEALAAQVNGEAVGFLAKAAKSAGAKFVHFSTDYVFGGKKKEGYLEDDKPNPISAYGRSKLAGESVILSIAKRSEKSRQNSGNPFHQDSGQAAAFQDGGLQYYIIRTSWLYGHHGKNFVETMLALADKGGPIRVVDDQIGSPTYAADVARATLDLVESNQLAGIYHRTNSGSCSWYEFAKEIFSVFGKEVDLSPCTTKDFPRPAMRPQYSVLKTTKLPVLRPWQDALGDYQKTDPGSSPR